MAARTRLEFSFPSSVLLIMICSTNISIVQSSMNVVLTSTLAVDNNGHITPPGEEVVFICTTRYSSILQWSSNEYISSDGYHIQIYNGTLGNDVRRGSAHAILVQAALENGVLVLVSELRIRTSALHPTATIECNNDGYGSSQSITFKLQNVTLTSTLTDGLVAYGEEEIIFTCTTRHSSILQWSSSEYISSDGYNIQVYNGTLGTDVRRGSARAILVRAALENGVLVLVSELRIRTSILHPRATIECNNDGHGSSQNITFALQNVTLTSTLTDGLVAYGEEEIIFTCTTRHSSILQWSSSEYINRDGYNIQVYNGTLGNDVRRGSAHAILVRAAIENGVLVLVSELRIRASTLHSTATIECNNDGHGSSQTITFSSTNRPILRLNSSRMFTCPGERIRFECAITHSQTLVWMSEIYFEIDPASIRFSYNSTLNVPQPISNDSHAILTNKSMETGIIDLTAMLSITVRESIIRDRSHSIICLSDDVDTHTTISFHLAETCEEPVTTSVSTESNIESGSNDNSQRNLPIVAVVVVLVVAAAIITTIIVTLWTFKHKGRRSNQVNQTKNTSQYRARDTPHKEEEPPPTSPSNSTRSSDSDNKSVPDSGSTSSSVIVIDDSVELPQDLMSITRRGVMVRIVNSEETCFA